MPDTTEAIVVLVTTPTPERAAEIARALVEERLAACGNVLPAIRSIYRWEGKVQDVSAGGQLLLHQRACDLRRALRRRGGDEDDDRLGGLRHHLGPLLSAHLPSIASLSEPSAGRSPSHERNSASAKSFPRTVARTPSPVTMVVPSPGT